MSILSKPARAFARLSPFLKGVTVIGVGILGFVLLMVFRPRPAAQEPPRRIPLVVTAPADVRSGNLTIRGSGTVRPKSQIVLSSQVAGRVEWVSPAFASGGRFEKGDLLLRIEPADYVNRVDAASAAVAQREVEVLQWKEEQELAREEYQRLVAREGLDAPDSASLSSLIFREPQLQAARANLRSAEAQLADARLALGRTRITAPFDGLVRAKSVDIGQYVAPGQNLGSLYDTDEVEIVVPLTDAEASLVDGIWEAGAGDEATRIPATVSASFGSRDYEWPAYVDRAEGALNEETRTVDVVVRVPDPFVTDDAGRRPPLLLGTYASVDIQGAAREAYVVLPRMALRDGDVVYVVEQDTLLVLRPAELLQAIGAEVFVSADIAPGEPVVVSPMNIVTDSMAVEVADGGAR
ncbi:MAG: efflux RND transporter periplasmic adaptor subunit [Gemmatimonadetes bacterium]|nr:efflux RND transporter periplasmic adaptor subunit [Gemmatimonadota bacterium]